MDKKRCSDCKRERPLKEFWKSNNLEMYPEGGKVDLCRSCLTGGVEELNDFEGVRDFCKIMDYPFIKEKWEEITKSLIDGGRYDDSTELKKKDSIRKALGDYARIMKLGGFKNKTYADSDEIITLINDAPKIAEEVAQKAEEEMYEEIDEFKLSVEEKAFLMRKWNTGDLNDILYLEEFYLGMMEDYEIVTTSHKDYLKKIAVISLELDKALKNKDWDTVKVLRITYSSWMKEANFTAAQNEKDKTDFVSSFGEIAAFLEVKGFIDTIDLTYPRDIVDKTIGNLNSYTRDLVLSENGLGDLLEATIELMNAPDEDEDEDYEYGDDDIWADEEEIDWTGEEIVAEEEEGEKDGKS